MHEINEKQRKFAINFIMYFFCFISVCIVGISNVFGLTYTDIGDKADITVVLVSTAYGDSPFNVPKNSAYNFNQVLEIDYQISNYNFEANKNYQLESHLTQQQLTNANYYSVQGLNGEQCLISYENTIFTGAYPRWAFQCPHATNNITLTIRNSDNQYLWVTGQTNIFTWTSALLKYSTTSLSSDNQNTDAIINNNNQNTQNIINNNNQNTQDIINNNNENTQKIIDENKKNFETCKDKKPTYVKSLKGSLFYNNDKVYFERNDLSILVYEVEEFDTYTFKFLNYNRLRVFLSDTLYEQSQIPFNVDDYLVINNNSPTINEQYSINVNKKYIYMYLSGDTNSIGEIEFNASGQICTNKLDETKDAINNLNDTLKDDDTSGATSEASEFFNSFSTETFGLTSIITAPLNLIRSVLSSSCTDLQLPLPYLDNKKLILPCMTSIYSQYFGTFFTIYQTITYGIIAYWVCVRIFNQVKDFKNPEHDEIEVMDL